MDQIVEKIRTTVHRPISAFLLIASIIIFVAVVAHRGRLSPVDISAVREQADSACWSAIEAAHNAADAAIASTMDLILKTAFTEDNIVTHFECGRKLSELFKGNQKSTEHIRERIRRMDVHFPTELGKLLNNMSPYNPDTMDAEKVVELDQTWTTIKGAMQNGVGGDAKLFSMLNERVQMVSDLRNAIERSRPQTLPAIPLMPAFDHTWLVGHRALIDQDAWFINYKSSDVAHMLANAFIMSDRRNSNSAIDFVVYINDKDEKKQIKIIRSDAQNVTASFNEEDFDESDDNIKENGGRIFYYYDQRHIVGSDLKQSDDELSGICTIGSASRRTDVTSHLPIAQAWSEEKPV